MMPRRRSRPQAITSEVASTLGQAFGESGVQGRGASHQAAAPQSAFAGPLQNVLHASAQFAQVAVTG